jgi:hypothetical protein
MPVCQVCQKDNRAGAEYCEDCGAALNEVNAPSPGQGAASITPSASESAPRPPTSSADLTGDETGGSSPAETDASLDVVGDQSTSNSAPSVDAPPQTGAAGTTEQRGRLVGMRYGAPTGEEIPLLGQRIVVGRFDPETGPVDVDLSATAEASNISRHHGELYRDGDGQWMVRDLGSTNGIFVRGSDDASFGPRITAPRPLADGDEVAFGNARFVFRAD